MQQQARNYCMYICEMIQSHVRRATNSDGKRFGVSVSRLDDTLNSYPRNVPCFEKYPIRTIDRSRDMERQLDGINMDHAASWT
jgi:hypothetical protein